MTSPSVEVNQWYEQLKYQKLTENDKSSAIWCKYKADLETTKSLLSLLPKKLSHSVMVPIGPKALMPGRIVHTNEFLVNLGETWFVKRTGHQSVDICNRRIKTCDEMIAKLEKERDLILSKEKLPAREEAFGSEDRPEIIEYVTEEENEEWKRRHRIREREYRQKLAELRNKEKKSIETEEDLWKHLDELELQEELEDELNRLDQGDSSSSDDQEDAGGDVPDQTPLQTVEKESESKDDTGRNLEKGTSTKKRRVSFACDADMTEDEPLRLYITHTDVPSLPCDPNSTIINSPGDIYNRYVKSLEKTHSSVLRSTVNPNREKELEKAERLQGMDSSESEGESLDDRQKPIFTNLMFKDVTERTPMAISSLKSNPNDKAAKVSRFKASRSKVK